MSNLRVIACQILYQVLIKQKHLKPALLVGMPRQIKPVDKAWVQIVCYQSLRFHQEMTARWQKFTPKPIKDKMLCLLLTLSVTQKFKLNTPDYAIVNEAIKAAKKLKKPWASGLLNKVLKLSLADLEFKINEETILYNHPKWWIDALKTDWPEHYQDILNANNKKPPLWIRCKSSDCEITGENHPEIPSAKLIGATDITESALFNSGEISVQDASAQLAAILLDPAKGDRILDACAAPGGKSCHLLQLQTSIQLDVLEKHPDRMQQLMQNLKRIGASANTILGDATRPEDWYKGDKYDKILLDVPCSASGVVRRNPDIKLLRKPEHIEQLAGLQQQILNKISPLLKIGGHLLYVSCSVFKQENQDQIEVFLTKHVNFVEIPIVLQSAKTCNHGVQIITGTNNMDGFYYCLLKRLS